MKIITKLDNKHVQVLHELYQNEWWTKGRTIEETHLCVKNSQIVIAMVDKEDNLIAFVRVLTDYVFKALILDVIVAKEHRGKGLGKKLLSLLLAKDSLKEVKHFELYCSSEMIEFYELFAFDRVENLKFMRMEKK